MTRRAEAQADSRLGIPTFAGEPIVSYGIWTAVSRRLAFSAAMCVFFPDDSTILSVERPGKGLAC